MPLSVQTRATAAKSARLNRRTFSGTDETGGERAKYLKLSATTGVCLQRQNGNNKTQEGEGMDQVKKPCSSVDQHTPYSCKVIPEGIFTRTKEGMDQSDGPSSSVAQPQPAACKEPVIPEGVKTTLNNAFFGQSRAHATSKTAAITGVFTSKDAGQLRKPGSDVILRVPKGAVPKGKTYTISGEIHTNLVDYERLLEPESEHFLGPIAEFSIEGGGEFKKPVEIEIPIYITEEDAMKDVQVFRVENGKQEQITNDETQDMNFRLSGGVIIIRTFKFSMFYCKTHGRETIQGNMMLTLHAKHEWSNGKRIVQVKTGIHFRSRQLKDFERDRAEIMGTNMEELERKTFKLPHTIQHHPNDINVKLNLHSGYGWEPWCENGEQLDNFENTINGEDVMCTETDSSIPLGHFSVQHQDQQMDSLTFHVVFKFNYPDGILHKERLACVYRLWPEKEHGPSGQTVSGDAESMKKIVILVSENITTEIEQLGIQLDVPRQRRFDATQKQGPDASTFTRCHRLLTSWMESKGTGATPQVLIEALKGVERMDLAQKVKDIMKCRSIVRPKPE